MSEYVVMQVVPGEDGADESFRPIYGQGAKTWQAETAPDAIRAALEEVVVAERAAEYVAVSERYFQRLPIRQQMVLLVGDEQVRAVMPRAAA